MKRLWAGLVLSSLVSWTVVAQQPYGIGTNPIPPGFVVAAGGSGSASLTVGSTAITGGTTTRVLYDNAGVLGEYPITGSGSVMLGTSPTITTSLVWTSGAKLIPSADGTTPVCVATAAGTCFTYFDSTNKGIKVTDGTNSWSVLPGTPTYAGTVNASNLALMVNNAANIGGKIGVWTINATTGALVSSTDGTGAFPITTNALITGSGFKAGASTGVSCGPGLPSASFTTVNGIVTVC